MTTDGPSFTKYDVFVLLSSWSTTKEEASPDQEDDVTITQAGQLGIEDDQGAAMLERCDPYLKRSNQAHVYMTFLH